MEETVGKLHATGKPFYLQFHTYAVHGPVRARPDLKQDVSSEGIRNRRSTWGLSRASMKTLKRMLDLLDDPNGDGDESDSIAENTVVFLHIRQWRHACTDNLPLKGKKGMLTEGRDSSAADCSLARHDSCRERSAIGRSTASTTTRPASSLPATSGVPLPETHPLDGESFAHVLRDPATPEKRDPIFYLFPGYMDSRAQPTVVAIDDMASKRYKIYYYYESGDWELYCLSDDPGEKRNLIEERREIASELSKQDSQPG